MTALLDHYVAAEAADMEAPWRDRAACRGRSVLMDPPGGHATTEDERQAREVCWGCDVLTECGAWVLGLTNRMDPGGMCGAMTLEERKSARRRRGLEARQEASPGGRPLTCTACDETKPADGFSPDATKSSGRASRCRECAATAARLRRQGKELVVALDKAAERSRVAASNGRAARTQQAAERYARFGQLRDKGYDVGQAALALEVSRRQADRYETRRKGEAK